MRAGLLASFCLFLLVCAMSPAYASDAGQPTRHTVLADGHPLALWEKRPASATGAVLLIHGRTWSALAQEHPEAISALVLYGLPTGQRKPTPTPGSPPREPNTAKAAASDFITPGAASPAVIDAYVKQALASDPVRVDWKDEDQFVYAPARVRVPTLFLYGARDPLLVPEAVMPLFAALGTPDRAWITLPNSDHAAHVENSQPAWLHAIVSFVERPRAGSP